MTDLDRFLELYKSFGVECIVTDIVLKDEHLKVIVLGGGEYAYEKAECTKSSKFVGYSGFYSNIEFDINGKFIRQGFWE